MVGKKTQPQLKGDEPDGVIDIAVVKGGKKRGDLGQVSAQYGAAVSEVEVDPVKIRVFSFRVAAGAEAVAEVVMEQPRLDGVQIDETDRPAGLAGKEDVGWFGIAVDRAES